MQSLSDTNKLNEVTSFNSLCRTPIRVRKGTTDDNDAMDEIPLDDGIEEENEDPNQSLPVETSETSTIASDAQNLQEQTSESASPLDPKTRKARGGRMDQLLAKEKSPINASSKPSKDEIAKERLKSVMGAFPKGTKPKKYSFQKLDFKKILDYFVRTTALQSDEKQWYTSVGLKPNSSNHVYASLIIGNCNAIRVSLLVWKILQSYKLNGDYAYLNESCFRDSLINFLISRSIMTTDSSVDACQIQSILEESSHHSFFISSPSVSIGRGGFGSSYSSDYST